jgi:flavin reductase (DIM6/NTAB) family NADH-FMN oxidoreductase RutF
MFAKIEGQDSSDEAGRRPESSSGTQTVDERTFRRVTALFPAGVTVITTRTANGLHGLTVSAFSPVSWQPPLVLACIESLSQSRENIQDSGIFAVNFLSDLQEFLAERFAGRAPLVNPQFEGVPHHFEASGAPILDGALAWLDCRVEQVIQAGDHTVFLGRVAALGEGAPGHALVYFARQYRRVEP